MNHLVLHDITKATVSQFLAEPAHALLLVGKNGIGKTSLAEAIAMDLLHCTDSELKRSPYYRLVQSKTSISIETIRELQRFLQLRTIGTHTIRRVVIIEHAELLTIEAQNAFLKILEEPPRDTVLLLTVDNQRALLSTIMSRVQSIQVYAPAETALKNYFAGKGEDSLITQAYFLSGGLPGLMHALLEGDTEHPLITGVAQAKTLLQSPTFERMVLIEPITKQKEQARYTIEALQRIAQAGLDQAALKNDAAKLRRWHHILSVATEALDALASNANTKLVLANLVLHMG